jgi:hypothetical protein
MEHIHKQELGIRRMAIEILEKLRGAGTIFKDNTKAKEVLESYLREAIDEEQ